MFSSRSGTTMKIVLRANARLFHLGRAAGHTIDRVIAMVLGGNGKQIETFLGNFTAKNPKKMLIANRRCVYYELDHRHLVDERRSVSHACGLLWRGLVQTAGKLGIFAVFL